MTKSVPSWRRPAHARSVRDEFSQIRTTMTEAQALTTLGDRPLIVLTAEKDAQGGWIAAQDKLAALSTNSVHRTLADADHACSPNSRRLPPNQHKRSATSSMPSAPEHPSPDRQAEMKTKTSSLQSPPP